MLVRVGLGVAARDDTGFQQQMRNAFAGGLMAAGGGVAAATFTTDGSCHTVRIKQPAWASATRPGGSRECGPRPPSDERLGVGDG
jgi:hypothetical protein